MSCTVILCWLLELVHVLSQGGGGFALHYSRLRADTVSFVWEDPGDPGDGSTVEFWAKITDPNHDDGLHHQQFVLAAGVSAPSEDPPYECPYELEISLQRPALTRNFYRRTFADVELPTADWVHLAFVHHFENKSVLLYVNGTLAEEVLHFDRNPIDFRPFMIFTLAQDAFLLAEGFSQTGSLDGAIDELRVWNSARTSHDILKNFRRSLEEIPPDLKLYFDFYQPGDTIIDKASGVTGWVGRIDSPRNIMSFGEDGRAAQKPTSPAWIASRAPIESPLYVVVIDMSGPTTFKLPHRSNAQKATVLHGPKSGQLKTSGSVMLSEGTTFDDFDLTFIPSETPPEDAPMQEHTRVTFNITDELETLQTVTVVLVWDEVFITPNMTANVKEDVVKTLTLGGIDRFGSNIPAVITRLPEKGKLFSFLGWNVTRNLTQSLALSQHDLPWPVDQIRGKILYLPPPDAHGESFESFLYRWVVKGNSLSDGEVTISIQPINDPPTCLAAKVATSSTAINITLTATDVEQPDRLYYTISQGPRFGTLMDPETSSFIMGNIPCSMSQYTARVVNGSSQWTDCPKFDICSKVGPGECFQQTGCSDLDWHADQMVGPPDFYPKYGDSPRGWGPSFLLQEDWLVMEIETPVYVTRATIYEVYKPGYITSILVASNYTKGEQGVIWHEIWSTNKLEKVAAESRAFSPPICPVLVKAKYIKIVLNESTEVWGNLDAAMFEGFLQVPSGVMSSNRVRYVSDRGIHAKNSSIVFDSFNFRASDCADVSAEASVDVLLEPPDPDLLLVEDTFFAVFKETVMVHENARVTVDLEEYVLKSSAHLHQRLETTNWTSTLILDKILTTGIGEGDHTNPVEFFETSQASRRSPPFPLSNSTVWVNFPPGIAGPVKVYFTINIANVVYRILGSFWPECGEGFFQSLETEPCMPCSSVSSVAEAAMADVQRRKFYITCPPTVANTSEQRTFWMCSLLVLFAGTVACYLMLQAFRHNKALTSNLVQKSFLAIVIPDCMMCLVFQPFYAANLVRGEEISEGGCLVIGFLTYGIVIASFAGPVTVSWCTWKCVMNTISGHDLPSQSVFSVYLVTPWVLAAVLAGISYASGTLGSYRGLYCYTRDWAEGFAGVLTLCLLLVSGIFTGIFYFRTWLIVSAERKRLGTVRGKSIRDQDEGTDMTILKKGAKLVAVQVTSWLMFSAGGFANIVGAHPPIWVESAGAVFLMLQPVLDSYLILQGQKGNAVRPQEQELRKKPSPIDAFKSRKDKPGRESVGLRNQDPRCMMDKFAAKEKGGLEAWDQQTRDMMNAYSSFKDWRVVTSTVPGVGRALAKLLPTSQFHMTKWEFLLDVRADEIYRSLVSHLLDKDNYEQGNTNVVRSSWLHLDKIHLVNEQVVRFEEPYNTRRYTCMVLHDDEELIMMMRHSQTLSGAPLGSLELGKRLWFSIGFTPLLALPDQCKCVVMEHMEPGGTFPANLMNSDYMFDIRTTEILAMVTRAKKVALNETKKTQDLAQQKSVKLSSNEIIVPGHQTEVCQSEVIAADLESMD